MLVPCRRYLTAAIALLAMASVSAGDAPYEGLDADAVRARAVVDRGQAGRVLPALEKARRGEKVVIAAIGGSITQGAVASRPEFRWANRVAQWWIDTFPQANIVFVNAGIGATGSDIGAHRVKDHLLRDRPDFVLVEYAVNDSIVATPDETLEGLLRQVLAMPNHPGALLLMTMTNTGANVQDKHIPVGKHYGLPIVSFRDAMWPEVEAGRIAWEAFEGDMVHPNDRGHAICADLVIHVLEKWLADLPAAGAAPVGSLPAPLISDVFERAVIRNRDNLTPVRDEGWESIPGSQYGRGWAADKPGSVLEFDVEGTAIGLIFWRIKGPMGVAEAQVDQRPPVRLEGWFNAEWGGYTPFQMVARDLDAGRHRLRISLLEEKQEGSTGHRFEVHGVACAGAFERPVAPVRAADDGTLLRDGKPYRGIGAFCVANVLLGVSGTRCQSAPPVREFDAWITAVDAAAGTVTVRHNPTQYTVTLRTDLNTVYQRVRQAPCEEFPDGQLMRFWGAIDAEGSSITIQGIRRAASDDALQPTIVRAQNHIAGRLRRGNEGLFIDVGERRVRAQVALDTCEGYFEEMGAATDLQAGRQAHVRYDEEASGGRALLLIVTTTLPPVRRPPSPPSGATPEQVQQTFRDIAQLHAEMSPQLARLMPVTMTVRPELAKVGERVTLQLEVLADASPHATLEILTDVLAHGTSKCQDVALNWRVAGECHGLTVYRAESLLPTAAPGSHCVTWNCDIGGDIPEFRRYYAVIDESYAVCMFLSTSHRSTGPGCDLVRLHMPYEEWIGEALNVNAVLAGSSQTWAAWSRECRQWGTKINPHLFGPYWVRGAPTDPQANLQAESRELQQALLEGYRDMLPRLGFGPTDMISAYTMNNSFSLAAREAGYKTISSLCSGQNFMDGPMRINHFGMPDRPYFISLSDFRQAGPGGPTGLVGIPQCQRNTFLNREFNCTYCLEPAWNEYHNAGGGRVEIDDIWMSRMYDFFDAMLQNRLSQATPYFFNVGLEFNGVAPGIAEGNRLLIEYAARKARTEPLVFSTGPAVSDYYRRHFQKTPETSCYQQDYFGGLSKLDKFVGYPDTLEIEGPEFQALMRAPELLPVYQYDYQQAWDYPAWGNEDVSRNRWGYLYPGQHDRFVVVPKILDTRRFHVQRADAERDGALLVSVTVQSSVDQKNLVLALWDLNRAWHAGTGWWSVEGSRSRFVPVRAPFTGNLNGLLVCDVVEGQNQFAVKIETPPRTCMRSTLQIGESIEGRVFQRDGQWMAYLWPTRPWEAALVVSLTADQHADAYVAPTGERQALTVGENRLQIPAGQWMRLVGLSAEEIVSATSAAARQPPAVIFDTDMGSDCDDAGALAVLHALADAGEVRILGVVFSSGTNRYGVGACDAINTYYGRGDLPLGQYQGTDVGDPRDSYTKSIATDTKRFGHDTVDNAPDMVSVYRTILESAPDHSVTIITVGHPHALVHLMRDRRAAELVRAKVDRWVAMGMGGWNFQQMGMSAYTQELLEAWPMPFYISPSGADIVTGHRRLPKTPETNPVREAYRLWNTALVDGRSSWDQVAVLSLVRPELFKVEDIGRVERTPAGGIVWNPRWDNPQHHLVTPKVSSAEMAEIIEELMARAPRKQASTERDQPTQPPR